MNQLVQATLNIGFGRGMILEERRPWTFLSAKKVTPPWSLVSYGQPMVWFQKGVNSTRDFQPKSSLFSSVFSEPTLSLGRDRATRRYFLAKKIEKCGYAAQLSML
jgi:hypothetical protein